MQHLAADAGFVLQMMLHQFGAQRPPGGGACQMGGGMLDAGDAQRTAETAMGRRPGLLMAESEFVDPHAEQPGIVAREAGRNRQQEGAGI